MTTTKNNFQLPQEEAVFKNVKIQNSNNTQFIHKNYHTINATSISSKADTILNHSIKGQRYIADNGLIQLNSKLGKVEITSSNTNADAILIKNSNTFAGITIDAGDLGFIMNSAGGIDLSSISGNIQIGGDNTENIEFNADESVTVNSNDTNIISTDDIILKSTVGDIILDTGASDGGINTIKATSNGNVLINKNITTDNYQVEIDVTNESSTNSYKNGLLISSSNADVSPEIIVSYSNDDNSRQVINTMGTYSENSTNAQFKKYLGFQFDNKLVAIEGVSFLNSDIGKKVIFKQTMRSTTITGITNIILPVDNTYITSDVSVDGTYTGNIQKNYKIEIDGVKDLTTGKLCDTFKWSNDSGINYSNTFIPITEALTPYPLEDGITIQFDADEGNELGEFASFSVKLAATVSDTITVPGSTDQEKMLNSLSNTEVFITTAPFNAYFGTVTNNDIILKTSDQERFRVTADGSLGASKEKLDARLHITSEINSVSQVNDNLVSTGENLIGHQINPVSTELNTGGYIVAYESQQNGTNYYDIYGDYFTANGEKVGNNTSFKINKNILYNQSHPHICKSGVASSDNYMVVWSSQDPDDENIYQIRGSILKNGNEFVNTTNDLFISSTSSDILLTPRVCGLKNGNYVITYASLQDETDDAIDNPLYSIKYVIVSSTGNILKTETRASNLSNDLNYTYPYICELNTEDPNTKYAGGFVIAYMKEVFSADNRYQIVYKVFSADGDNETPEHEITTTGERGEVGELKTDFNLSDGRCSLISLPRNEAANNNGGFIVCYQTNFSASVEFITNPTRTITGLSSGASGDLTNSTVNPVTGVHTIVINAVNGDFLKGELLSGISDIQGLSGFFLEKIESISSVVDGGTGIKTSTIILSKDPRHVIVARYSTNNIDNVNPGNMEYRQIVNTTTLENDRIFQELSVNDTLPMNFVRANSIYYAYRGMPTINHNNDNKGIICWQSGFEPNIYYQQFNISNGSLIDLEELIAEPILGYRQTDPFISKLKTTQGNILGYNIIFNSSSLDQSKTGIFQELIGPYSYLIHMNNSNTEFVFDNYGKLGIGTDTPNSTLHIKSVPGLNTTYTDQVSMTMQISTDNINNSDDLHKISFTDGSNDELARIKVKYSNGYQDMNPDADNLIAYFKLDESPGSLVAVDSGLYNLQVETDSNLILSNLGASALLIDFNNNKCWKSGLINNGLEFNGLSSYLKIPKDNGNSTYINTIDELQRNDFTISFWLKIDSNIFNGTRMDILSFGETELTDGTNADEGYMQISLIDNDNNGNLRPNFKGLFSVNESTDLTLKNLEITGSTPLNDGNWHNLIIKHIISNVNGTNVSRLVLYQDSIEIGNSDTLFGSDNHLLGSPEEINIDYNVYIGSNVDGNGNFFRGMMDELRFYRSVLTQSQINRIYKYGSTLRSQLQIQTLGNNTEYSDQEPGLIIDDTGAINSGRFKNNIARQLSGVVKISLNTPNVVEGLTGTKFIKELQPGDNLYLDKTPDGQDIGSTFAGNFYQVEEIYSDTRLRLNRQVEDIISDTYFNHVTVRPSIMLAYDDNEEIKMNIDFNGDMVVGQGKTYNDVTKLEIRGDDSTRTTKNGLALFNTNNTVSSFYDDKSRYNNILFRAKSDINTDVTLGSIKVSHSKTSTSDNKGGMDICLNSGTDTTNNTLQNIASFYGTGKINFVNEILERNMLNDIQFNGRIFNDEKYNLKMAFLSNEPAEGVYTESSHLNFYGGQSLNVNDNVDDKSALVKILVSNDKPAVNYEQIQSAVNGRIDFKINKQLSSSISGLKTRFCSTSLGYTGVHIPRPDGVFDVAPEFNEDLISINPITTVDNNTKKITFTDDDPDTTPMFSTLDERFLRCGRLVVNDGTDLTSYVISSGIDSSILEGDSKLIMDSNEDLIDAKITGHNYTLHYPGIKVNKYGLVGIGDSRFNDDNTNYHLSVSGNVCVKGEMHFAKNIDDLNNNEEPSISMKSSEAGELLVKDANTFGYVRLFGGIQSSSIVKYSTTTNLTFDEGTILINNSLDEQINIALPSTNENYVGRIITVKKISSVGSVRITSLDAGIQIDDFDELFLANQYSSVTMQTDGVKWFIVSSHLVPDDFTGIVE